MKNIKIIILILFMYFLVGCNKETSVPQSDPGLFGVDQKKIEMRKKAQTILSEISIDKDVQDEILNTINAITQKFPDRDEAVYFKEFLKNNWNSVLNKYSTTAEKFNLIAYRIDHPAYNPSENLIPVPTGGTSDNTLSNYLITEDEEIYMPYHEDFSTLYNPTCTHQNLSVSENSNTGTKNVSGIIQNKLVTDVYAQANACWIVGKFDDNRLHTTSSTTTIPINPVQRNILLPMYINLGQVQCTDFHEGLFKGGPEIRIYSTNINLAGNTATAQAATDVLTCFTRKEVRDGVWKASNTIIDQSWEFIELNKRIGVYEDDNDGILGALKNIILPLQVQISTINISINAYKSISTKDEDLGHVEFNRGMFFSTNIENNNLGCGTRNGWPVYCHGGGVKYTIPRIVN